MMGGAGHDGIVRREAREEGSDRVAARVSIKDVAALAGVSWKTVSNVVNDRPVVRPETRARVERAIDELGYVPNAVGRELRGGSTKVLSLVVPELTNPYFARLAEQMQVQARRRGLRVSVEVSLGDREVERAHACGRTARPVDAVILSPSALTAADLADRRSGPRLVLLGESMAALPDVMHVAIDNVAAAVDVVRHLVEQGRSRILFLGAEQGARSTGGERVAGFHAALRFAGLEDDPRLLVPAARWDETAGHDALAEALAAGLAPDAVLCANDRLAVGALAALREAQLSVPERVAVTGWDDLPSSAWIDPPLTTVAPDLEALISAALDAALAPSAEGAERVVPHRLLVRTSSRGRTDRSAPIGRNAGGDAPDSHVALSPGIH